MANDPQLPDQAAKYLTDSLFLRAILDAMEAMVYVCTADLRVVFMNRRLIERTGYDGTGKPCYQVLHDRPEICPWCPNDRVLAGEHLPWRVKSPKDQRWYDVFNHPIVLPDGSTGKLSIFREISDSPGLEENLPVFRELVDRLNDAIFFADAETGRVLYANDRACQNLGYTRDELLTLHVADYAANIDSLADWKQLISRVEKEGYAVVETRHHRQDGSSFPVEANITLAHSGQLRFIVSIARDTTERKQIEAQLIEEKNKLSAVMEAIGDGITVQDRDFRILYQNEVQIRKQGLHLDEHCYRAYRNREDVCDGCLVEKAFADGRIHRRETTTTGEAGTIHLEVAACPLRNADGEVVACVEVVRDITDKKRVEQSLRESDEKYRLLFSAESDAIITYDAETEKILEVNAAACHLYGWSPAEFAERRWRDLQRGPDLDDPAPGMRRLPRAFHLKRDGDRVAVEISSGDFSWQNRKVMVKIVRDITEPLRLEQLKDEMLSGISHEMRTPLTAMIGFTEFLLENETDREQQKEFLGIIAKESDRLMLLIDNILNLQRLRAGFGIEAIEPIAPRSLLRETANIFIDPVGPKRIRIDCPSDIPQLLGDESKLLLALKNLLANAIKYSPPESEITIGARWDGREIHLWVRDLGPGIAEADRIQIFDRFFRGGKSRKVTGTGLGLSLVREIANAHKGRAWLESTLGCGSTFYISLPAPAAPAD